MLGGEARLAWVAVAVMVLVYGLLRLAGADGVALACKPLPVAWFAAWVFLRGRGPGARVLAAALALDAVADVVIDLAFLGGLAVFLVGHVARIVAFTLDRRSLEPWRALPFAALVLVVGAVVVPTAGALGPPIALYALVIGAMGWRAAARVGASPDAWLGLVGAVLYLTSDTLIAADRFLAPLPAGSLWVMATYWGAQALIARSAL